MDEKKPAYRSRMISVWKWAAMAAVGVGGLAVPSIGSWAIS
jgi:hypothetical protein